MPAIPPLPSWDALHVVIVHVPIGLLLIAPLLMLAGMFPGRWRDGLRMAALILLVLGTAAAFVAKESGEAAAALVDRTPQINAVLEEHAELADTVTIVFTIAASLYIVFFGLGFFLKPIRRPAVSIPVQLVIFGIVMYGVLAIAATGHLGGRMVHEMGVRAMM